MTTEIVVASYRESLRWIPMFQCINHELKLLPNCTLSVYRTGTPMEGAVMLENKGREASQWLEHIVRRYDSLADVTFFVQADLGASFGKPTEAWPHDLNLFKNFYVPPMDGVSFRTWPSMERLRCNVTEPGMTEDLATGIVPEPPKEHAFHHQAGLLWDSVPKQLRFAKIHPNAFLGAQHILTREFIRRAPLEHYQRCLQAVKDHELAHWLEFGNWPVFIYDIYRQGPLA